MVTAAISDFVGSNIWQQDWFQITIFSVCAKLWDNVPLPPSCGRKTKFKVAAATTLACLRCLFRSHDLFLVLAVDSFAIVPQAMAELLGAAIWDFVGTIIWGQNSLRDATFCLFVKFCQNMCNSDPVMGAKRNKNGDPCRVFFRWQFRSHMASFWLHSHFASVPQLMAELLHFKVKLNMAATANLDFVGTKCDGMAASRGMQFSVSTLNFVRICATAIELWALKEIQNDGVRHFEHSSGVDFDHVTCLRSQLLILLPNFANVSQAAVELLRFVKIQNGGRAGSFLHPSGGLNPPTFVQHPQDSSPDTP